MHTSAGQRGWPACHSFHLRACFRVLTIGYLVGIPLARKRLCQSAAVLHQVCSHNCFSLLTASLHLAFDIFVAPNCNQPHQTVSQGLLYFLIPPSPSRGAISSDSISITADSIVFDIRTITENRTRLLRPTKNITEYCLKRYVPSRLSHSIYDSSYR